jgi:CPA2 family monovalent cation:H+ antiporter-2
VDVSHLAQLLIELGAVIFGLGVLARVALRFGFSPIPLYLLAGLAFGAGGLLPLEAPDGFFNTGSEIGVILLLLMIGLEYTAEDLVDNLKTQAPIGVLDLLVNGLPGMIFALLMGWDTTACVAMFGVTAVSSSGIISKVLSDLGRLGNRETPAILGVLVLEDLAMALYLPVLTALAASSSGAGAVKSVIIALIVLTAVLFVALRFGAAVTALVSHDSNEILLLRLMGLALLVAGVAEAARVSAAVGAFLLGIALSSELAERVHTILEPLRDIFAAVFFVFFGLNTDPSKLPAVALPALALALVGIATKLVTGWFAGARAGVGRPARLRAGAALIPRGEFSIIVAGLVVTGTTSNALAATTAAYVLVLAVVGPLAPRLVEPFARRLTAQAAAQAAP